MKSICDRILLAATVIFGTQALASQPTSLAIDDGSGVEVFGTSSPQTGNGWSWDNSTSTLTLNGFAGTYIGATDGDTLNIVLSGVNTITVPSNAIGNDVYGIKMQKANSFVIIGNDGDSDRDSLWIGQTSYQNKDYTNLWGIFGGVVVEDAGLGMKFGFPESLVIQVRGVEGDAYLKEGAGFDMDFSNTWYVKNSFGVYASLYSGTEKNISIKMGSTTSGYETFATEKLYATGTGKISLFSPAGFAVHSGMNVSEGAGPISFMGKMAIHYHSMTSQNSFFIAENKAFDLGNGKKSGYAIISSQYYHLVDEDGIPVSQGTLATVEGTNPLTFVHHSTMDIPSMEIGSSLSSNSLHGLVSGGKRPYSFYVKDEAPLPKGIVLDQTNESNTFYLRYGGKPSEETPAGTAVLCVTDANHDEACVNVEYGAITQPPKYLIVNDSKCNVLENCSGTGWHYDHDQKKLKLVNFTGSYIGWEIEDTLNIELTGTNTITIPENPVNKEVYGIQLKNRYVDVRITGDGVGDRDSLWIGQLSLNNSSSQSVWGIFGNVYLENAGLGMTLETQNEVNTKIIGIENQTYVNGNAGLDIDFSAVNKTGRFYGIVEGLYANTSGDISVRIGSSDIGYACNAVGALIATGSGKVLLSSPKGNAVANGFNISAGAGDISFEGMFSVYYMRIDNDNGFSLAENKVFVLPSGKKAGLASNLDSYYRVFDEDGVLVKQGAIKSVTGKNPLTFMDHSSMDIPDAELGSSLTGEFFHGLVAGGKKPYLFYAKEDAPLPEGVSIRQVSSTYEHSARYSGKMTKVAPAGVSVVCVKDANDDEACVNVDYGKVYVNNPITSISLAPTSAVLGIGKKQTITPTIKSLSGGDPSISVLDWNSSKTSVATVSSGIVTAVGAGVTTISATAKDGHNQSASATIYVKEQTPAATVSDDKLYLLGLTANAKYSIDGEESSADAIGRVGIRLSWYNKTLSIIRINDEEICNSDVQSLEVGAAPGYTVSFNMQGHGSDIASLPDVTLGSKISEPEAPTSDGYVFGGWYKERACENAWNFETETVPAASVVLYAKWTPVTYNVVFHGNSGTGEMSAQQMTYDVAAALSSNQFERADYGFIGWDTDPKAEKVVYENTATVENLSAVQGANVDLYAVWKKDSKNIILPENMEGFSITCGYPEEDACSTVEVGGTFVFTVKVLTNYGLVSGNKIPVTVSGGDAKNTSYNSSMIRYQVSNVTDNVVIGVSGIAKKVLVQFKNTKGNLVVSNNTSVWLVAGQKLPKLSTITATGYDFLGWYTDDRCTTKWDVTNGIVVENMNLYAEWILIPYNITFVLGEGETNDSRNVPTTYDYETEVILYDASKDHYDFLGWYTEDAPEQFFKIIAKKNAGDKELHPKWTPTVYNVTYEDLDGGVNTENNIAQTSYTILSSRYDLEKASKTGYNFVGWFDGKAESAKKVTGFGGGSFGDLKLYARFELKQFDLTFYDVLGDSVAMTTKVFYNNTASVAASLTAAGYKLNGWCTDKTDCEKTQWDPSTPITDNLTVYAYWVPERFTISFDLNGGLASDGSNAIAPVTKDFKSSVEQPAAPTRENFKFSGWKPALPATMPSTNITVVAQWTAESFSIIYNLDGGENDLRNPVDYTVETPEWELKDPSKKGYVFAGWFRDSDKSIPAETVAGGESGTIYLYASWTIDQYVITVKTSNSVMGSVTGTGTYDYGTKVSLVATPSQNYHFTNWTDDAEAKASREITVSEKAEYTANFAANEYKVTLNANGGQVVASLTKYIYGVGADLPKVSKKGYEFGGWFSSSKFEGNAVKSISTKDSGDKTYYAKWTPVKSDAGTSGGEVKPGSNGSDKNAIVVASTMPQFRVFAVAGKVQIEGARLGTTYAILDMRGRVVNSGRVNDSSFSVVLPHAGSFLVRVGKQTLRVNVK